MWHRYINQVLIYKSRPDIIYLSHIYKSDRYLAKSASYLYIRGGYTNIAFVSVFDTFGTPYHVHMHVYVHIHVGDLHGYIHVINMSLIYTELCKMVHMNWYGNGRQ